MTTVSARQRAHQTAHTEYIIPSQLGVDQLLAQLEKSARLIAEPKRTVRRTFYDTFDWRLYATGTIIEERQDGKQRTLLWHSLGIGIGDSVNSSSGGGQTVSSAAPRFAKDLPTSQLRDRLEPIIEMRELMPLVQISAQTRSLRVLDKIEKTVVRLVIETSTVRRRQGSKAYPLAERIAVVPVKGFQKPFAKIVSVLKSMGLAAADENAVLTSLALVGHTPGDYSSKLNLKLDPAMRSEQATRIILQNLLDVMLVNEDGTRKGSDTEFLHDFRVSIRRTRAALSQIKGVLPERAVNHYKEEFAWLGQITSPLRDLDVYLLSFDNYRDSLPASERANIEPLRDFLLRQQQREHSALKKSLGSARYRRLVQGWSEFLEQPLNEDFTLKNSGRPILDLARERIWKTYRRIIREGAAISADSSAEALHDLRKSCKKLRYLMEFFQSLFAVKKIKVLIKTLKSLQENLGDFQDYDVQVTTLKQFSQRMVAEAAVPTATLLAMGMLIEGLERRQQQARDEFSDRFKQFALADNRTRFHQLFAPPTTANQEGNA